MIATVNLYLSIASFTWALSGLVTAFLASRGSSPSKALGAGPFAGLQTSAATSGTRFM